MNNVLLLLGGVIIGVLIEHFFFKSEEECNPDNEEAARLKLFSTLTKIKADIESKS